MATHAGEEKQLMLIKGDSEYNGDFKITLQFFSF